LDDISDAVSFCAAPAWIFYITLSTSPDPLIERLPVGLVASAYVILGIARLVYFTVDRTPIPGFFKGMPTPAAALFVVAPLIMFAQASSEASSFAAFWGVLSFGVMILAAVMMNLFSIRYLHLGRFMDAHPWFTHLTVLLAFIAAFTPYFGLMAFLYLFLYLLSPIFSRHIEPDSPVPADEQNSSQP
jgi:CDP-diacylglycerol--serine O-phosphatidyltransferase